MSPAAHCEEKIHKKPLSTSFMHIACLARRLSEPHYEIKRKKNYIFDQSRPYPYYIPISANLPNLLTLPNNVGKKKKSHTNTNPILVISAGIPCRACMHVYLLCTLLMYGMSSTYVLTSRLPV